MERLLMISNKHIYMLNKTEVRKKVRINKIVALTESVKSGEMVINFNEEV